MVRRLPVTWVRVISPLTTETSAAMFLAGMEAVFISCSNKLSRLLMTPALAMAAVVLNMGKVGGVICSKLCLRKLAFL